MKVYFRAEMKLLGEGLVYRTESESRPGLFHYTMKLRHGGIVCTCEGWQFGGSCKHALNIPLDSHEALEIQAQWRKQDNEDRINRVNAEFDRRMETHNQD